MTSTVRKLHQGLPREFHSTNVKAALSEVLEDLVQVDGLLARFQQELLNSAGPIWRQRGFDAILEGKGLPSEAEAWRTRYLLVRGWMELHVPTRLERQQGISE